MISFNYLRKAFPNDPGLIEQVVDIYISEYPEFISKFTYSVRNRDMEEVKKLVHKWQYTAKILGLIGLQSDLMKLEEYSSLTSLEIDELTIAVLDSVEKNFDELKAYKIAS
ncbi:MAG: hypothetical protein ABJF11_18695 [Reichenbachiella sp.]|uniref:hypothetical protein n=1 Tax=Reichenbachiella sp. TaxID=2184521 RepID=UPI003267DCCF